MDPITKFILDHLIETTAELVMPVMLGGFLVGFLFRWLIFYTARAELRFCTEFEKRVRKNYSDPTALRHDSFFTMCKILMEKTFHECFEMRNKFKRRNLDHFNSMSDRVFLIQDGAAYLVRDTLRQVRYLKREGFPPKMLEITKGVFDINPVFNKILGIFPSGMLNELINIMPGLLIIGGIFGTFLGIAKGLPELGGMDLANLDESKKIMDLFLVKISQAMIKSIIGIGLSVIMSLINTLFSAEGVYYNVINRFANSLELLWNETTTNHVEIAKDAAETNVAPPDHKPDTRNESKAETKVDTKVVAAETPPAKPDTSKEPRAA